jgi:hypothetical protein
LKVLFLCKSRNATYGQSFGLVNSCRFVAAALRSIGIAAVTTTVVDANCIDREVCLHRPTHVFIEALWVTPDKVAELAKLHGDVLWRVRIHSKMPFLASEGMAIDWIRRIAAIGGNLRVSANHTETCVALAAIGVVAPYYPNIYWPECGPTAHTARDKKSHIDIGCFGAVRPLKNHLVQALAAIDFAKSAAIKLHFHVNGDSELRGDSVLRNLEAAFIHTSNRLVVHQWYAHANFMDVVRHMDIGMQVSLSETFDIVAADFVWCGVPCVASPEVDWLPDGAKCDPASHASIVSVLGLVYSLPRQMAEISFKHLSKHNEAAMLKWWQQLNETQL